MKKIRKKMKNIISKIRQRKLSNYYIYEYYNAKINDKLVLFESKKGEDVAGNIFYLMKECLENHREYKVNLVVKNKPIVLERITKILKNYNLKNINLVFYKSKKYYNVLATAKYLFNDTTFPLEYIKKDGQICINTWHGTPLKMMGKDVSNRKYALGNVQRNFLLSDYLIYPNDEMKKKMFNAYYLDDFYEGKILYSGYPRNSVFFDEKRRKKLRKQLKLENKEVFVYMPTWRGIMTKKATKQQTDEIKSFLDYIDINLTNQQILYVKMHVLAGTRITLDNYKHIKEFPCDYETYDFLNLADTLITDYSSVFFDFANTGRKIILFGYDYEEYTQTRGMYYDAERFPFPFVKTKEDLLKEMNNKKIPKMTSFIKKFCKYDNLNCSKNVLNYVFDKKNTNSDILKVKNLKVARKVPVTLIYVGSLALNGLTTSVLSFLSIINHQKEKVICTFREESLKKSPMRLEKLDSSLSLFPIIKGFKYTYKETLACILYYRLNIYNKFVKNQLNKLYTREFKRKFSGYHFDKIIHYTGYEKRIIGMFQRADARRYILVHNDMLAEIKTRHNQHYLTLKEAYNNYNKIVTVTEDIIAPTKKIANREDIVVLNNAHNYKSFIEKSRLPIKYDENTVANCTEDVLEKILNRKDLTKFITIGRFSYQKGHIKLLDAFNEFYKKNKNTILIIIGGHGPLYKDTINYLKTLECKYNVIIIKSLSNPYNVLGKCDLFILSSNYEALGLVLLEADTLGVPCISTDIPGPRGFMKEHGGTLVENSVEGLLKGMNDFKKGKIKCMNFDAEKYNQKIKEKYEKELK